MHVNDTVIYLFHNLIIVKFFYFIFLQSKLSKLSQATKLEPLNEGGGSALLQMVSVYNDPSSRAVIIMIVQQYTINLTQMNKFQKHKFFLPLSVFVAQMLVGPSKFLKQIIYTKLNRFKNPIWLE